MSPISFCYFLAPSLGKLRKDILFKSALSLARGWYESRMFTCSGIWGAEGWVDTLLFSLRIFVAHTGQLPIFVLKAAENSICRVVCLETLFRCFKFTSLPVSALNNQLSRIIILFLADNLAVVVH